MKVARKRRSYSPNKYYFVMQSFLSRITCASYRYRISFSKQYPSVEIAILLNNQADTAVAVAELHREFEEFDNMCVFVTHSEPVFMAHVSSATERDGNHPMANRTSRSSRLNYTTHDTRHTSLEPAGPHNQHQRMTDDLDDNDDVDDDDDDDDDADDDDDDEKKTWDE